MTRPLEGLTVLEFCQYMAGPLAGLRLADLGARVIKIERPGTGEGGRRISIKNMYVDGDSLIFHTVNRNKRSVEADLKDPVDLDRVRALIAHADIMTHNFRPGVMERIGLGFDEASRINPGLVYAVVSGYGESDAWKAKPGQDLLAQAMSGACFLTGDAGDPPTPLGAAVADIMCGNYLVHGILAALRNREETGRGSLVEVSLLESMLDIQFEMLTTYMNGDGGLPVRAERGGAHVFLGAPYGVYRVGDDYLAIAMNRLETLADEIGLSDEYRPLFQDPFAHRNRIMEGIERALSSASVEEWAARLGERGLWCAPVMDFAQLVATDAYKALDWEQDVVNSKGSRIRTSRTPIRIDGEVLRSQAAAPPVGEHTEEVYRSTGGPSVDRHTPKGPQNRKGPLEGLLVVDFSQFLAGPFTGLRLADLGARVIKIEQPGTGDICRRLYASDVRMNGDSSIFHAINRNKESFLADLKVDSDRNGVLALLKHADVMISNFRPGVLKRLGVDYESVRAVNPRIVCGEITGFGTAGPWRDKPGQDLVVQAISSLMWMNGDRGKAPVPYGVPIVDMVAGTVLTQAILALIYRRYATGEGGRAEVNMLESILDLEFEALTTFFRDGGVVQPRAECGNAHPYHGAPYGVYPTADGFLALAMTPIPDLGRLISCPSIEPFTDPNSWYEQRDAIKGAIAARLAQEPTAHWLAILETHDIWCAEVLDWERLFAERGFKEIGMTQEVRMTDGYRFTTTRCPIRFDGRRLLSEKGSPKLGEHTEAITRQFNLSGDLPIPPTP